MGVFVTATMSAPTGQSMYQNDQGYGNQDVVKPGYNDGYGDVSKGGQGSTLPPPAGGICDLNCDWGNAGATGNAGACHEITKLEPCCGEPCNPKDGLYCCLCSTFCGLCVQAKMLAYSNDQECYFVNHCGPILIVYLISLAIYAVFYTVAIVLGVPIGSLGAIGAFAFFALYAVIRRNIRMKYNVGSPDSWLGDFFMFLDGIGWEIFVNEGFNLWIILSLVKLFASTKFVLIASTGIVKQYTSFIIIKIISA